MASKRNASKRPYTPPSFKELNANEARAELEATGIPEDPGVEKMLSATDERLKEKTKAPARKVGARRAGVKRPVMLVS